MKYYIQDTRSYVGNSILFWGPKRSGYTTKVEKAGLYTEEEARNQCESRKTDIAWPENYIKERLELTCDAQKVNTKDAKWNK